MSEWYRRQFGDQAEFALAVALRADPYPSGAAELDVSWGSIELWAGARCLTRSVSGAGVVHGVEWNLLSVLEWFASVAIRLVNEEPYPRLSRGFVVPDGSAWFDATSSPPMLSPEAERRWFLRRSAWRHHHALRRAAEDVALPNVVFKRQGDDLEVSWDNVAWAPPRPDLTFVERRGRALVAASTVATVLVDALQDVASAWAQRVSHPRLDALASAAGRLRAAPEDWRWLIHRPTAEVIRAELPSLSVQLDEETRLGASRAYVPHTPVTQVLRHVRLERREEIESLLRVAAEVPVAPLTAALTSLFRPHPASAERPWEAGNEHAERVRDALGWGDRPVPDLDGWLMAHGVYSPSGDLGLPPSISLVARRSDDLRGLAYVNPKGGSKVRRETGLATALGHLLLDDAPVAIDGDWEHWPTAARARAFGVALLLPEEGVRGFLGHSGSIGPVEVKGLMARFGAGPVATTYRLRNLGLINHEEQGELARAVS